MLIKHSPRRAHRVVTELGGFIGCVPALKNEVHTRGHFRRRVRLEPISLYHSSTEWRRRLLVLTSEVVLADRPFNHKRILWKFGKRHFNRAGIGHVGFFGGERNDNHRAAAPAISSRDFQPAQPSQFQHTKPDNVHTDRSFGNSRRDQQHLHYITASSIRIEGDLVAPQILLGRSTAVFGNAMLKSGRRRVAKCCSSFRKILVAPSWRRKKVCCINSVTVLRPAYCRPPTTMA
jgi:hypothetical protein